LPSVKFDGRYAQASLVLSRETTPTIQGAAYNGIVPADPLSESGGWGAWESPDVLVVDLNDQLATANGVTGGKQTIYTAGLNWYVTRFMFNYLHGDVAKQVSAGGPSPS
jgi:phosphate-selective porin OprO and OprP